jgi:hypothetical protein
MILRDRTTLVKWQIVISDGQIQIHSTSSAASDEPVIPDSARSGVYWKLYIDDGQIFCETVTSFSHFTVVAITDAVQNKRFKIVIEDGQIGYTEFKFNLPRIKLRIEENVKFKLHIRDS